MPQAERRALSLLILLSLVIPACASQPADKPNIVFILSDNQSYYEMSCHGHAQIRTPHIDALAGESVEFTHFYAEPFCSPSRTVLMTGRHAMRSGVFTTIGGRSIMHRRDTTLPQILRDSGYHTAIFGKWHLGFSYPYRPQDRGFDEVFVHGGGGVGQMEDYFGNTLFDTTFVHNGTVERRNGYCTDTLFDEAIEYVEEHKDRPFFCFVSTPVTHSPHHGPKELVAQLQAEGMTGNVELFAQVMNLDANIGRMTNRLQELGLADNTLYIYASDQGMSDRGAPHGSNRMTLAHDPAQHAPLFIRLPGGRPFICDRLTGIVDVFPTILDYCGIESPVKLDGQSLLPLLREQPWPEDRTMIIQCPRNRVATKWKNATVRTERWRFTNGRELYDIKTDPRQKSDVADEHPEVIAELTAAYEDFWAGMPDQQTTLSRHLLGAAQCPEVTLNGMDWYRGATPWHQGAFRSSAKGAWAVTVLKDGRYSFECRVFPREADRPLKMQTATLIVGESRKTVEVGKNAKHATIELKLKAGDYDLEALLENEKGSTRGALFVYVKTVR